MCSYRFVARNTNLETTIIRLEAETDVEAWKNAMGRALSVYGAFLNGVELINRVELD